MCEVWSNFTAPIGAPFRMMGVFGTVCAKRTRDHKKNKKAEQDYEEFLELHDASRSGYSTVPQKAAVLPPHFRF